MAGWVRQTPREPVVSCRRSPSSVQANRDTNDQLLMPTVREDVARGRIEVLPRAALIPSVVPFDR